MSEASTSAANPPGSTASHTPRAAIDRILSEYNDARQNDQFGSAHPLWQVFGSLARTFETTPPVSDHPLVRVKWSVGQGKWTNVPWLAYLDSRETTTTQRGVYPVLLFRQDGSAAYLAVAQGVTEAKAEHGTAAALELVRARAAELRPYFENLADAGFTVDGDVELRSDDPRLGKAYEASVVCFKQYDEGALPSQEVLSDDLGAALDAYEAFVLQQHGAALVARVDEWRAEIGYPADWQIEQRTQREPLATAMSEDNVDRVIEDPAEFNRLDFGQFAHKAYGGPGPMSVIHIELNKGPESKRRLARALRHLLYDDGDDAVRIDDVVLKDEWRVHGFGESLATKAVAVVYPDRWLPLFKFDGEKGKRRIMESPELGIALPDRLDEMTVGQKAKWSNDALRHLLEPLIPGDPSAQKDFLYWLRDRHVTPANGTASEDPLATVASELLLPVDWLHDVVQLLQEKRQIIFQGPPGTGKTFVARRLAQHFVAQGGGMEVVQFHPSYAYEDFVEGYRPTLINNQPGFEIVEGPLKRLARKARADQDPDHVYVLLIDELNRGNVPKVFGELYYLLEYRNDKIRLQYGAADADADPDVADEDQARFGLPPNLWIIGTTNTADRSIALMDAALLRRFYFVDYYPTDHPIDKLLERWLKREKLWPEYEWLVKVLAEANLRMDDRDAALGPSYFLLEQGADLTEERVARIWRHAITPYVEERLIGEPRERLKDFELETLRKAVAAGPPAASGSEGQPPEVTTSDGGPQPTT